MKKIVLIALVLLVMVGCSETEVDTPSFADGEAIAIVKQKVNKDEIELNRWYEDKIFSGDSKGIGNLGLEQFYLLQGSCNEAGEILSNYHDAFEESYLGNGIWSVSIPTLTDEGLDLTSRLDYHIEKENIVASWKVYEASGTVEFTGEYTIKDTGKIIKPFRLCPRGAGG